MPDLVLPLFTDFGVSPGVVALGAVALLMMIGRSGPRSRRRSD